MASNETNTAPAEEITAPADATPGGDGTSAPAAGQPAGGDLTDAEMFQAELDAASRKAEEAHEAYLRARADFANYKRRVEEERESLRQFVSSDLLARLLPIVDNFERALAAAAQTTDYEKLVTGVNAVYRQLQDFLAREGVTAIDALYQPFDPNVHNAVLREETTDYPENTVVEELQKGYALNGKVLRPTMVKVATGTE
jgi:molecular chaperone GrpE